MITGLPGFPISGARRFFRKPALARDRDPIRPSAFTHRRLSKGAFGALNAFIAFTAVIQLNKVYPNPVPLVKPFAGELSYNSQKWRKPGTFSQSRPSKGQPTTNKEAIPMNDSKAFNIARLIFGVIMIVSGVIKLVSSLS